MLTHLLIKFVNINHIERKRNREKYLTNLIAMAGYMMQEETDRLHVDWLYDNIKGPRPTKEMLSVAARNRMILAYQHSPGRQLLRRRPVPEPYIQPNRLLLTAPMHPVKVAYDRRNREYFKFYAL
ncbi:hypothetical protein EB796_004984 [Bugula neritina]|uniref:Uncharacterized protein n=1 Tax=Bugula neritina TaxID=10212 RepID=A0A7J7KDH7_BUGNE|nr:hypothetical protein EB796_004984 [Bugula neritina]